jgi:hypothetical protein
VWTLRCLVEGYWATCCEQAQPHAQTLVEHIKRHGRPTFDQVRCWPGLGMLHNPHNMRAMLGNITHMLMHSIA